jgi:hypothetical protein
MDGNCDDHAARKIRRKAHQRMEHIGSFMQSHYMPPSDVCSRRISPADVMVFAITVV